MEAPGWDQLISGEINAPSLLANVQKTRAETAETGARTAETTARSQLLDTENQQDQAALDLARAKSPLEKQAIQRQQLALAMSTVSADDPDASTKWDAQMKALDAQGNTDAAQYVGKYTSQNQQRWTAAYAADSPLASLDALNGAPGAAGAARGRPGAAGGGGGDGSGAYDPGQMAVALGQMSPQEQQQAAQKVSTYKAALAAIDNSPNPAVEFARQAAALGHPEWSDPSKYSPIILGTPQQPGPLRREIMAWDQALQSRQFGAGIGAPAPTIPQEVKEAGGTLYGVNPAGTRAQPLTPGPSVLVGTDPTTGRGVYYSPSGGRETTGTNQLGPKPGTAGRGTAYEQRRQAWLDVHPNDEQGALDYAAGRGGSQHIMGGAQIQVAAAAAAARDVANGVAAAGDEAALTQQYATSFAAAQSQPAAGPAPSGGGGWGAPTARSAAGSQTVAQHQAAKRFASATTPEGTRANPLVPVNDRELQQLVKGAYFIAPDGSVRQKSW